MPAGISPGRAASFAVVVSMLAVPTLLHLVNETLFIGRGDHVTLLELGEILHLVAGDEGVLVAVVRLEQDMTRLQVDAHARSP